MLLTANEQTVDFFSFDYSKYMKMGVSLSGGSDSALLFYLMAKYSKRRVWNISSFWIPTPVKI